MNTQETIETESAGGSCAPAPCSVICGEFETVMPTIPDESVTLVFTSPPYGVGMDYETDIRLSVLFEKLNVFFREAARVTKRGGYVCVNFGDIIPAREMLGTVEPCEMPMGWIYWSFGLGNGLVLQAQRVWKKTSPKSRTASTQSQRPVLCPKPNTSTPSEKSRGNLSIRDK